MILIFFYEIKTYKNHLGEQSRPLLFASSDFFYENKGLTPREEVQLFTPQIEDENSCNRRVFKVDRRLFKIQLASSGITNEARLEFEFMNSKSLPLFFKEYGVCRMHCDGKFMTTISRDFLTGRTLDSLSPHDTRGSILVGFIQMVEALSSIGLRHNDLRPWNLVWDGKQVQPLDLGSISETATDANSIPQSIAIVANAYLISIPNSHLDFSRITKKQLRKLLQFASSNLIKTDLITPEKLHDDIRNYSANSSILKRTFYRFRIMLSKIKARVT